MPMGYHCKKKQSNHEYWLTPYKHQFQVDVDQNVKDKTGKHLEDDIG